MSNATKPDALEMLRDHLSECQRYQEPGEGPMRLKFQQIIAALEAERAEMERKVAAIANRDAKIRKAILSALHPDTSDKRKHLYEAFALLLNDTIAPVVSA